MSKTDRGMYWSKKEEGKEKAAAKVSGTKTKKRKSKGYKTEGKPRSEFKKANRAVYDEVAAGDLKNIAKLRKAMKRNGVMLTNQNGYGLSNLRNNVEVPVAHTRAQHNYNVQNSGDPVEMFMKSIQTPGVYDVPFIDANQVAPISHGVLTGLSTDFSATTGVHHCFFVMPAMSFAIAPNIGSQYKGFSYIGVTLLTDTLSPGNIIGNAGEWDDRWGNTTAATRIAPWSIAVDITLRIPEAVVQGSFWMGNAPFGTVAGATLGDIIQMSESISAEKAGATYTVKGSLLDRGLIHSPYGALYTPAIGVTPEKIDYPYDERVSWIIFSPASIGTIGAASAPTSFNINYTPRCNYVWVPDYQPQVVGTTQGQVSNDTKKILDPYKKAKLDVDSNMEATNPHDKRSEMAKWCPGFSKAQMEKGLEGLAGNAQAAFEDPLSALKLYGMQMSDIKYYLNSINKRWGDWSTYGEPIASAIASACDGLEDLRNAFARQQAEVIDIIEDFNAGSCRIAYERGKPKLKRVSKSGRVLESGDSPHNRSKSLDASSIKSFRK